MKIIRDNRSTYELDEFLQRPLFAHLATNAEQGPRESPVWYLWEDGALWIIGNQKSDTFPGRLVADPRSAVGIVDFDASTGKVHHVGFRGAASLEPFDRDRARRIFRRYLGGVEDQWDKRLTSDVIAGEGYLFVRFVPESVVIRDQSYTIPRW